MSLQYHLPDEFNHHEVQLSDMRMHYVREGNGPPLLLWHGWPGFWWDWRYLIKPLSEHFDVIVPDFRGCGDSEKTDFGMIGNYAISQLAQDQADLLTALGIEKAYIVAHDYGSMTAHKFLRDHSSRVHKAVLLDPVTPQFMTENGQYSFDDWYFLFSEQDVAVDLVSLSRESREVYYGHFYDSFSYRKPLLSKEEFDIIIDSYMKPGNVEAGMIYDRANIGPRSSPFDETDLEMCDVPVSVLWAKEDPSVPWSAARFIPELYSDQSVTLLDGCGHHIMIEKPEILFNHILDSFKVN